MCEAGDIIPTWCLCLTFHFYILDRALICHQELHKMHLAGDDSFIHLTTFAAVCNISEELGLKCHLSASGIASTTSRKVQSGIHITTIAICANLERRRRPNYRH